MISVVIPLYNKQTQIARTISCVLSQTFQDFEIVIVNDGSTDDSVAEVEKFTDSRIRLINKENGGVCSARNCGINAAKGDYVALLDADDEWKPLYLEIQHALITKYPDCRIFCTNYEFCYANGKNAPSIINRLNIDGEDGVMMNYFEVACHSHPPITSISIVAHREALLSVEGFPIGIKSGEDLYTWARLAVRYKIAYSKKVMAVYNLGDGYDFANLPPRRQDSGDPVGKELKSILSQYPDTPYLRQYISHWHKMRASVAIRYGEKLETLFEVMQGFKYNPFNVKLLPFAVLALLPLCLRKRIIALHS